MLQLVDVHLAEALETLPLDVLGFAIALRQLLGELVSVFVAERPIGLTAHLRAEQRRLRRIHATRLDQRLHVLVEQGQHQASNVAAVDVGVTQDNDASIAGCVELEVLARTAADGGEQRLGFGVCLLYTSPSPRDRTRSRMPSSA